MDSPQLVLSLVKVKVRVDSSYEGVNILDVAKQSLMAELSSAILRYCSCCYSLWRYVTLIDIFGGDDGARFVVASECYVLEVHKEAIHAPTDLKDLRHCSCCRSSWRYVNTFGGGNGL